MRFLLALLVLAAPAAAGTDGEALTLRYACDGGVTIEAAYINLPDGPSLAVIGHDGALVPLHAGPTGSGVRYIAYDRSGLVWHTKGDDAFLAHDNGNSQTTLVDNCYAGG